VAHEEHVRGTDLGVIGDDERHVRDATVADPRLRPLDDVLVALLVGLRPRAGGVRATVGFRDGQTGDALPALEFIEFRGPRRLGGVLDEQRRERHLDGDVERRPHAG
jgi:hypothetical protein